MRAWPAVLLLIGLGGCASMPSGWPFRAAAEPPVTANATAAHAARVRAVGTWRLAGRIAVQRDDQGVNAGLDWRQDGARFDLRVAAPLNGGTFALAGDDATVTLVSPDGERFTAASAEALMSAHLGWMLPVGGARWWVRGVPAPAVTASQEYFDDHGRWTDFEQSGWRVSVLDYVTVGELSLPRKLYLSQAGLQVRVVVKSWEQP
ncbi:MAG: lipoprotein insertase outer membrane protein LolB [Gammaproteobacteria bacterium]